MSRKAKAIIDSMVESQTLTPGGRDWLIQVTDPFHDKEITPVGYPDINNCSTICQAFTITASIMSPVATGTWDAHVFFMPMSTSRFTSHLEPYKIDNLGFVTTQAGKFLYPGFNVVTCKNGVDWVALPNDPSLVTLPDLRFPDGAAGGNYRMVAGGFEVVNTTPELFRGGSITAYRSPSCPCLTELTVAAASGLNPATVQMVGLPPSLQSQAQLYPNSRTWEAAEGCYSICTLSDVDNKLVAAMPNLAVTVRPFATSEFAGTTTHNGWGSANIALNDAARSCINALPWDNNGCIITGLQPQATLQVTVKYFIERIPTIQQPDLLVLARPPLPYDPMALEIYTRAMSQLPVGVMVKENPLGEWFNDVLATVAEYAPKVGQVFGPFGQMLGKGVGYVAGKALESRQPSTTQQAKSPSPTQQVTLGQKTVVRKKRRPRRARKKTQ